MSFARDLYYGQTQIDFVGRRRTWFVISAVAIAISLGSLAVRQLNLSLDFRGGVSVQVPNESGAAVADVRAALAGVGLADAKIQLLDGGAAIRVQTEALSGEAERQLTDAVTEAAGVTIADVSVVSVGPTFGAQISSAALRALVIFLASVSLFISWRFGWEWKMALAALTALFHDLVITFGAYAVFGFEVTPATVIAVLTILGYSLYDTVVVFDKVKENEIEAQGKLTYSEIVNVSMNDVLMRSIMTSLTSLIPVGSLLFVGSYILGAATLSEFALALFVGIAAGTYSSIFVASPLLATWKEREEAWIRVRRKQARGGVAPETVPVGAAQAPVRPLPSSEATPRPPKKRRKRR
ncbi:MAG: protein translocase subunit SecF [Acidimicrobiia bacterium]